MEPVFRTLEIAVSLATRVLGNKITFQDLANIPERGGAVIAINHTSYVDFFPAAQEAQVPIVPLIVWGAHRMWTKDYARNMGRKKIPITVAAGNPIQAAGAIEETSGAMRETMTTLLHQVQEEYPH